MQVRLGIFAGRLQRFARRASKSDAGPGQQGSLRRAASRAGLPAEWATELVAQPPDDGVDVRGCHIIEIRSGGVTELTGLRVEADVTIFNADDESGAQGVVEPRAYGPSLMPEARLSGALVHT